METEIDYLHILKEEYQTRSLNHRNYSMRAFARDLEMSPAMLSEVLRGNRRLSPKKAEVIAKKLRYSIEETSLFVALVKAKYKKSEKANKEGCSYLEKIKELQETKSLSLNVFKVVSDWFYFAILCVMELDTYNGDIQYICNYLKLKPEEVKSAIATMEELDLVEVDEFGHYQCKLTDITTSQDIRNLALRKFHKQFIRKAIHSIDEVEVDKRDITSMTMSIDAEKIPEAKKRIASFRRELCKYLESGKKNEVYNINIQFFPLGEEK